MKFNFKNCLAKNNLGLLLLLSVVSSARAMDDGVDNSEVSGITGAFAAPAPYVGTADVGAGGARVVCDGPLNSINPAALTDLLIAAGPQASAAVPINPSSRASSTSPVLARQTTPPPAAAATVTVPVSTSINVGVNTDPMSVVHSARAAYAAAVLASHDRHDRSGRIMASVDAPVSISAVSGGELRLSTAPSIAIPEETAFDHVESLTLTPRSEVRLLRKLLAEEEKKNMTVCDVLDAVTLERNSLREKLAQCSWDKPMDSASKHFRAESVAAAAGEASRPAGRSTGAASSKRVSFAAAPAEVVVAMPKPSPNTDWEPDFPLHPVPPFQYRQIKPVQSAAAPTGRAASTLASAVPKISITPWLLGIASKDLAKTR